MKRKALCAFLIAMLSGSAAFADTEQTVYVNGSAVSGFVTGLEFNGDNVTLTFDDSSTRLEDMSLVSIVLTYNDDGPTVGITDVETDGKPAVQRVYNVSGQYVGTSTKDLPKGVYIVNGKKLIVK